MTHTMTHSELKNLRTNLSAAVTKRTGAAVTDSVYTVWYSKDPENMMVWDPNPVNVMSDYMMGEYAHVMTIGAGDLDQVFLKMQGEIWSPEGEARDMIRQLGVDHTSMSVGDLAIKCTGEDAGAVFCCAGSGWVRVGTMSAQITEADIDNDIPDVPKTDPKADAIAKCKAWCLENYDRGADTMVECWGDDDYEELWNNNPSFEKMLEVLEGVADVYQDRQADALNSAF